MVYTSVAVAPFGPAQLDQLLAVSRANNELAGLTGILLYKDNNFMQVLEGEQGVVRALVAKIERDPRHQRLVILLEGLIARREFPEWSMAFENLDASPFNRAAGYNDYLNQPIIPPDLEEAPSLARRLVASFKSCPV